MAPSLPFPRRFTCPQPGLKHQERRSLRKARSTRPRLMVELLETRNLFSNSQWLAVVNGLPSSSNVEQQLQNGQNLLHAAGVTDREARLVAALDLGGTFVVETPAEVTQPFLAAELQ